MIFNIEDINKNNLENQTSLYLKQHSKQPVNWQVYDKTIFEIAEKLNRPIIVSVGYSSCHWCHVMAKEAFSDIEIADFMNNNFICVKVDREQNPDIDFSYIEDVSLIQGQAGWPLNVFLLPNGPTFYGGTYYNKENWLKLLQIISKTYTEEFSLLEKQANMIKSHKAENFKKIFENFSNNDINIDIKRFSEKIIKHFDPVYGGLNLLPKFPMPSILNLLLLLFRLTKDEKIKNILFLTLNKMSLGGIYDQIGGGFSRYSTDREWKVPHFEKMLYDNAQLISIYSKASNINNNPYYIDIAQQTYNFIERELKSENNLYFSALDADTEGEEGAFYTWNKDEFIKVLNPYSELMIDFYGIDERAIWENDKNILLPVEDKKLFAQQHFLSDSELASLVNTSNKLLFSHREKRKKPLVDTNIITSLNALYLYSCIDLAVFTNNHKLLEEIDISLNILISNAVIDNKVKHLVFENDNHGFLDDYSFLIRLLIYYYVVSSNEKWILTAKSLTNTLIEHFYDEELSLFWYSEKNSNLPIDNKLEIVDNVVPSSNSIMYENLCLLGLIFENATFTNIAAKMKQKISNMVIDNFLNYSAWANVIISEQNKWKTIVITGKNANENLLQILKMQVPSLLVIASNIESDIPILKGKKIESNLNFYCCSDKTCFSPVYSISEVKKLLQIQ